MKEIEKTFLTTVKQQWMQRYPFLKAYRPKSSSGLKKDACYLCDDHAETRKRFYFLFFTFSPKQPGQFSISVTVSDSVEKPLQEGLPGASLSADTIGTFTIAAFLGKQNKSWMLYDWEAQEVAYWKSLGVQMPSVGISNSPNIWKPSSFDLLPDKIIEQALADVNHTLETAVFTKLKLAKS